MASTDLWSENPTSTLFLLRCGQPIGAQKFEVCKLEFPSNGSFRAFFPEKNNFFGAADRARAGGKLNQASNCWIWLYVQTGYFSCSRLSAAASPRVGHVCENSPTNGCR